MIRLGTDFGDYEDDKKTEFGLHYNLLIKELSKHGKPTEVPGLRVSFMEEDLTRRPDDLDSILGG